MGNMKVWPARIAGSMTRQIAPSSRSPTGRISNPSAPSIPVLPRPAMLAELTQGPPQGKCAMAYWLMKTEPDDYSWDRLVADGETEWSGVRNHQAAANLRSMQLGERAFFYRSMVEPAIVGVMTIAA